jgi:hypothetical protein
MDSRPLRHLGIALLVPVLALPALFACQCGPDGPPSPPGACSGSPATSAASEIALGNSRDAFVPAAPGGNLDFIRGLQGADMVAFRVAVRTEESFTCLPVRLTGDLGLDRPIPVQRSGEWLVTGTLYQIIRSDTFDLSASSYGLNVSGTWIVEDPFLHPDAASRDAFIPDAPSYFDAPRRTDAGGDVGTDVGADAPESDAP